MSTMRWPSLLLCLAPLAFASLRDDLAPVIDLAATDTIVSVHPEGEGGIRLDLRSPSGPRTHALSVASGLRARVLASADAEGLKGDAASTSDSETTSIDADQARNRTSFNRVQGGVGAGVGYITVGLGLQPNSVPMTIGLFFLTSPVSYLGHHLYSRNKAWTDAHLASSVYASNTLYASTLFGTVFLLDPNDKDSWRAAAFAGALAYPVGLELGYRYGERHRDEPGRIHLAQTLANQGLFTGAMLPLAVAASRKMDPDQVKNLSRAAALTSMAGGIGGHMLGDRLFPERPVPGGLGMGVTTLANLGLLTSSSLAATARPSSPSSVFALLLAGNTAGTLAGLKILPERRDTRERALVVALGTSLGAVAGSAVLLIALPEDLTPGKALACPTVGAWGGYLLTTVLTRKLVESKDARTARPHPGPFGDLAFSPLVVPVRSEHGTSWTWPGLTVSLR